MIALRSKRLQLKDSGVANQLLAFNRIIPNAIVRSKGDKATYYGPELDKCVDFSSLHYRLPFEKVRLYVVFRWQSVRTEEGFAFLDT